jgi:hypothetical protein
MDQLEFRIWSAGWRESNLVEFVATRDSGRFQDAKTEAEEGARDWGGRVWQDEPQGF